MRTVVFEGLERSLGLSGPDILIRRIRVRRFQDPRMPACPTEGLPDVARSCFGLHRWLLVGVLRCSRMAHVSVPPPPHLMTPLGSSQKLLVRTGSFFAGCKGAF